jgi:hypothetical protein
MVIAGPVADAIGIQSWFILAGVSCILMALVGRTNAAVMNLEDHVQSAATGAEPASAPAATPASASAD